MVACDELYTYWQKWGNFCDKSKSTARVIDMYIAYRKKFKLQDYEINRSALYPMIMIQDKTVIHATALKSLKKICQKRGARNITRRMVIELINKVNDDVIPLYKIKNIPNVRSKMDGCQHEISSVSYETRELFDNIKKEIGYGDNDQLMSSILNYIMSREDAINHIKNKQESLKKIKPNDDTNQTKNSKENTGMTIVSDI